MPVEVKERPDTKTCKQYKPDMPCGQYAQEGSISVWSEFRPVKQIAELAHQAVDPLLSLEQSGAIQLPPDADRIAYLGELAVDWVLTHLPASWINISREKVLTWVHAELLQRPQVSASTPPVQDRLTWPVRAPIGGCSAGPAASD